MYMYGGHIDATEYLWKSEDHFMDLTMRVLRIEFITTGVVASDSLSEYLASS